MGRKAKKESFGFDAGNSNKRSVSGRLDPGTKEFFSEISNLFESCGKGLEERPVICGYALEEARGKEFELATDYYISHYLPNLTSLRVVGFSCCSETALKSLAMHLQYDDACSAFKETLTGNACSDRESLYDEIFTNFFRKSLFELSSHLCGNFVVRALEIDKDLLEMGKSGVIASLIAASQRLHTHEHEVCKGLADAGHSGELAMHPSGSYTAEKCFSASNLSLKEAIVSDLLSVQSELAKTKQILLQPDQWRSRQASKQSAYKDFYAAFGSSETISSKSDSFLVDTSKSASLAKELKDVRKEIDHRLASSEKYAKHTG
ncbi:hypothetical protein DKX38_001266 [Salix brachista]|uniref:Uncharacterized protein n=1 Tax=Salix brachista TaxID=2182728 RepID=A0A5N5P372_9ROSI|nr:hypothetical protein DKX38_001266 [Salix brachista]